MATLAATGPMVPTFVRVESFVAETADIFSIRLASPTGYSFAPGQFNMLYAFGVGEAAISVSGDPAEKEMLVHTIRAVGSVTTALKKLKAGDQIGIRGPFGSTWPMEAARGHDVVLVSGGIGLAPLRPAIYHLLRQRNDYGKIALLVGVRSGADLLFRTELESWSRRADLRVLIAADRSHPSWQGPVGQIASQLATSDFDPEKTIGLTCGPEPMMRFVLREFAKRGVPDNRLFLTMERNMQCAIGLCGHCQFGPEFVCLDGPVFRYDRIRQIFDVREI